MRRDGRGEDCILELSRSHPVGVICGKARERAQARSCRCHDDCADTGCV